MEDYKLIAAKAALELIKEGQTIGLGAGTTMMHLADLIAQNQAMAESLVLLSSSFKTRSYLKQKLLQVQSIQHIDQIDSYFDGCDEFDENLNALKSGGGIHTSEKIAASMAQEFILLGDESKFVSKLTGNHPLVIEILPDALTYVMRHLHVTYPDVVIRVRMSSNKDGAVITEHGNVLVDLTFPVFPDLNELNSNIKMIPGVVEHSLFYRIATKAIIAGANGVKIIQRQN